MGTVILIIAFIVEAAFVGACLVTRTDQAVLRSMLRLGGFVAFALFTLLAVLRWGPRWYLLGALLFTWAALGAWSLLARRAERKAYRPGRGLLRAAAMLLLVLIAVTPALVFPQVRLPGMTGPHPVATALYSYTDASRVETFSTTGEQREVNVEFWYPGDGAGSYPLVVFSHGSFGIKTSNTSTFMELASHGYVVCSIDHPYHSLYTVDSAGRRTLASRSFLQQVVDANNTGKYDGAGEYRLEQNWLKLRTDDIHFVLNTVQAQAADPASPAVYRLIDPRKIGLIGHSLGGAAGAQVARQRGDIGAVVNLDADLLGEYVDFKDGKEVLNDQVYPVPLLSIFADDMVRLMAAVPNADTRIAVKVVTASAPQAFAVHLSGTDHMSLTDLSLVSPFLVSVINASVPKGGGQEHDPYATLQKMNSLVLSFFNAYLKGEGKFTASGTD